MTHPNDEVPWNDLTSLLAGTLSPEDAARLEAWLAVAPEHRAILASLQAIWSGASDARPVWDSRAAIAAIKGRHANRVNHPLKVLPFSSGYQSHPSRIRRLRPVLVAAGMAGLAIAGWWAIGHPAAPDGSVPVHAISVEQYRTGRGQRLALKLPDGSGVVLGPESSIHYGQAYGRHHRVVELQGEAYFEVTHDERRPFEVRTAYAVARDLGTRFVVRARPTASSVDVIVAEGRVAIGPAAVPESKAPVPFVDSLILDRGELGRITRAGTLAHQSNVALDRYFGWIEGRLVFQETDLAEVAAELNRWYDVDIRLANKAVESLRLTGTFRDQPITEVLALIKASLGLELIGNGRHFTLADR